MLGGADHCPQGIQHPGLAKVRQRFFARGIIARSVIALGHIWFSAF